MALWSKIYIYIGNFWVYPTVSVRKNGYTMAR